MKQISIARRNQAIKLILDGLTFDEVSRKSGISKGSVVNLYGQLKGGKLPGIESISQQIEELRQLSVELKKYKISVHEAHVGHLFYRRTTELGVEPDQINDWIEICKGVSADDVGIPEVMTVALELKAMQNETGMTYQELLDDYEEVLSSKKKVEEEIEQLRSNHRRLQAEYEAEAAKLENNRDRLKQDLVKLETSLQERQTFYKRELQKCLKEHNLNLDNVRLAAGLFSDELRQSELADDDIGKLRNSIAKLGGLAKTVGLLEREESKRRRMVDWLETKQRSIEYGISGKQVEYTELRDSLASGTEELRELESQIDSLAHEVQRLEKVKSSMDQDFALVRRWISLFSNPYELSGWNLDRLVEDMIKLRQQRMGITPRVVKNHRGEVICQCQLPALFTWTGDISEETIKKRMIELVKSFVKNELIPIWLYEGRGLMLDQTREQNNKLRESLKQEQEKCSSTFLEKITLENKVASLTKEKQNLLQQISILQFHLLQ